MRLVFTTDSTYSGVFAFLLELTSIKASGMLRQYSGVKESRMPFVPVRGNQKNSNSSDKR